MASQSEDQPRWVAELQEVEWGKIEHAYGPAADVPEMIWTIVQGVEAEALRAGGELANNLNHQGSIYPATGLAVPFVIEALRMTKAGPRVRAGLLSLLAGIAGGAAAWINEEPVGTESGDMGDGWDAISFRDVFAAVWRGEGLYARLLASDPDADVRMQAGHVLGVLAGPGPAFAPAGVSPGFDGVVEALLGHVGAEEDGLALSSTAFALGRIVAYDPRAQGALRELLQRPGAAEAVRVAAALALVEADGERREEVAAVDVLVDTMRRAAETDLLFQPRTEAGDDKVRWSPWVSGRLRFRLCRALCFWSAGDEERMSLVLPALLVGVRAANGYTAEADIGPVLQWLWPGRDIQIKPGADGKWERELPLPVTAGELTGMRRAVVEECFANAGVWDPPVGNTDLAFMRVGLPTSRTELGKLLGKK
jgi:hypothetical protein